VGSQADRITDRLVNGLNGDKIQGMTDYATVMAPSLSYAMCKIAWLYGLARALFLHLAATLKAEGDKKSA